MQEHSPTPWEEHGPSQLSDSYTLLTQPVPSHPALLHKDSSFHGTTTVLNTNTSVMTIFWRDDFIRPRLEKKQGVRFQQKNEHNLFPIFHRKVKGKAEEDGDNDDGDDYEDDDGYEDEDA